MTIRTVWQAPTPCPDCGFLGRATSQHGTVCNGCGRPMLSRADVDPDAFFTREDADFLRLVRITLQPEI